MLEEKMGLDIFPLGILNCSVRLPTTPCIIPAIIPRPRVPADPVMLHAYHVLIVPTYCTKLNRSLRSVLLFCYYEGLANWLADCMQYTVFTPRTQYAAAG